MALWNDKRTPQGVVTDTQSGAHGRMGAGNRGSHPLPAPAAPSFGSQTKDAYGAARTPAAPNNRSAPPPPKAKPGWKAPPPPRSGVHATFLNGPKAGKSVIPKNARIKGML